LTATEHEPADFEVLVRTLRAAGVGLGAAEAHGVIAGVFAVAPLSGEEAARRWRELVLEGLPQDPEEEAARREAGALLEALAAGLERRLASRGFEFEPLLPGEEADLDTRVRALAEWCRGFLLGLVAGGLKDLRTLPGEAGEAVRDLVEIAEVELGEGESGEAAERALAELIEYVRAAVTLLYEDLHPRRA
jgi:uncharacterized protein YgfB (UPF0149 family)